MKTSIYLSTILTLLISMPDGYAESDQEALTQIEYNIGRAIIKKNPDMLDKIFADDFSSYSGQAEPRNKRTWITGSMSPKLTITEFRYSPFDIRVLGTTAIVQGSNEDNAIYEGKDISGAYTWLDVFEKRDGHWLMVANETAIITDRSERRAGEWVTITKESASPPH